MRMPAGKEPESIGYPSIREMSIGAWTIVVVKSGSPWQQNGYLVIDTRSCETAVVDPGACASEFMAEIQRRNLKVRYVLLTHGHHDHVGAVAPVCKALGLRCLVHEADVRLVRHAPLYAFRFSGMYIDTPGPIDILKEASSLPMGEALINVHAAPGHTQGGLVFEFPGFALTGDTILFKHIGRTDMPGGNAQALHSTVETLLNFLPANTVLLSGHGREWTVSDAREWWSSVKKSPAVLDSYRLPLE